MLDVNQWLTLFVGLSGVLSSAVIAVLAYSLNRQAHRAQADRAISESYNRLVDFRTEHPEVMRLSRLWKLHRFTTIYTEASEEAESWIHYYTYVELGVSFVNAVLYGQKTHLLDRHAYEGHYEPLVKLILTEHHPFFVSLLPASPYISSYIKNFIADQERKGWSWGDRHLALVEMISKTS